MAIFTSQKKNENQFRDNHIVTDLVIMLILTGIIQIFFVVHQLRQSHHYLLFMIQEKKNISDKGDDEGNENILCLEENKVFKFHC